MAPRSKNSTNPLKQARHAFARHAWREAYAGLVAADRDTPLNVTDLGRLAIASSLIGREEETLAYWTRAHHECLRQNDAPRAARNAFWLVLDLIARGEIAQASGWIAHAQRSLRDDCAERGLLLTMVTRLHLRQGDLQAAYDTAQQAIELNRRFDDVELDIFALLMLALIQARRGEVMEASALFDEIMVSVTASDVSPIAVGVAYCAVIEACQSMFDLARAREWTAALSRWCETQPDLVPFRGQCIVHRAEVMRLSGAWSQALAETTQACAWLIDAAKRGRASVAPGELPAFKYPVGATCYQLAELYRVRGDFRSAEECYREASVYGVSIAPGLALLRLAQGKLEPATTAIRTALAQPQGRASRAHVLAASVEITLAAQDLAASRLAADELAHLAAHANVPFLHALARHATGHVLLASGDAAAAVTALREAWMTWQEIEAPYEAARVRVLIGLAYRALGDDAAAELELESARRVFEQLAATPALANVESLLRAAVNISDTTLTRRERQVIALVATGRTNRAIAQELSISERTVDRHVSNILLKLNLSSRSAATAYAYQHGLM